MTGRGRYLTGDCAALALAVHEITGWPLVVMTDPPHVLVRHPDTGLLLDCLGPHAPDCLDGIPHHGADAGELAARVGRLAAAPDVVADAHELLASASRMPAATVVPLPWRRRDRRVPATAEPGSCGLSPA